MTNLENLKKLAEGLGADASKCSTNLGALNVISAALGGAGDAQANAAAIEDIAKVLIDEMATPTTLKNIIEGDYGEVIIPDLSEYKKVKECAFQWTTSKNPDLFLPATVKYEKNAFCSCKNVVNVTTTPYEEVESPIAYEWTATFSGADDLESVEIPYGVTALNLSTFGGCTKLASVKIPPTVTKIDTAFSGCISLETIDIPESVTTIVGNTFSYGCGVKTINIHKPENSISGAPWGASNATVNWLG